MTKLRVNAKEAAELLSVSPRTVLSLSPDILPRVDFGRSRGYSVASIAKLIRRMERGEIVIEKVNN